jgi:hypothetical protein
VDWLRGFFPGISGEKHMEVRERVNLRIMRAVAARKLAFAFPTQTVIHETTLPPQVTGQG